MATTFYFLEPESFFGGDGQEFNTLERARYEARLTCEEQGCDVRIYFHTEDENILVDTYEFESLYDYRLQCAGL